MRVGRKLLVLRGFQGPLSGGAQEAFLNKVLVERERHSRAFHAHDGEADAVNKAELSALRCEKSGHGK